MVVGRQRPTGCADPNVEYIEDAEPSCGPVGGIASALAHANSDCLILSCDLPFMTQNNIEKLAKAWLNRKPDTLLCAYKQAETGKIENLVAVYAKQCLPILSDRLAKKLLKISMIIPQERQEHIEYKGQDALPFFNINYPADLRLAQEYMRLKGKQLCLKNTDK